jgi:hypothetical protein
MYHDTMAENRPLLVTTERTSVLPLLIIDKTGVLGKALAKMLYEQFLVVLVTPTISEELSAKKNIIHIPYRKKIPLIPDNIYSHVFLFYNGEDELLDMLPTFMRKANESAGKLFLVTSLFHSSPSLFKHLSHHSYHHLRIMLYGEIFDNELQEENLLNYFIFQARTQGRIEVPEGGLGKLYPVHVEDVLSALIATAFAQARTSRILFAFPRHEINELSAARIMQKLHPNLKVDYRKYKKRQPIYYIPPEGAYCFPDYDIETRLRDIDFTRSMPRSERVQIKRALHRKQKRGGSPWLLVGILFLYFVVLPILLIGVLSIIGIGTLQLALKDAEGGKFASAQKYISAAHFSFSSASTLTDSLMYLDYVAEPQKKTISDQLSVGRQVTEVARDIIAATETLQNITAGQSSQPKQEFLQALATTKNSLLTLQKLKAEHRLPANIESKVNALDEIIALLENTGDTYPTVFGFNGSKKYLVLFQNNMELRPGGGFIGSYGLLTVNNGKTDKLQISDVYDADGKLTTHVEPPYGLRRYLGSAHWYLRDSNFDPDFTKNAQIAANFLQLETNEKVDGVIAVDTAFLQKLLKAIGPVRVEDYNETVTADNFYLMTQTHTEKDFFPGSTQKKDFLRALFNAVMLHLEEKKQVSYPLVASALLESIKGKHVMVSFTDSGVQEVYTVNNLSGALWDARSASAGTILDYTGIVDANIGTNKVNYYLKRNIEQKVALTTNGELQETLTVTYENSSKKDSVFGGDYKNYIRFLIPKNARLTSVLFDNQAVKTTPAIIDPAVFTEQSFLPPTALEVEQTDSSGKHAIGFVHQVAAGTKKTIAITYTIPQSTILTPGFTYNMRVFKQPGTLEDSYSLIVTYPQQYIFINSKESGGVDIGGKVSYQTTITQDKDIKLEFSKK